MVDDPSWSYALIFEGDVCELPRIPHAEVLGRRGPAISYDLRIIRFSIGMVKERRVRIIAGTGERVRSKIEEVLEPRHVRIGDVRFVVVGKKAYVEEFDVYTPFRLSAGKVWDIFEEHVLKGEVGAKEVLVFKPNCRMPMSALLSGRGYKEVRGASWLLKKTLDQSYRKART